MIMKSREGFIREFGKEYGEHWIPEMREWVKETEVSGVSRFTAGYFCLGKQGDTVRAVLYRSGNSREEYVWEIPGQEAES